jgi:cation-transporting ATPase 13A2
MTAIGSSTTNSSGANIFTKGAPEAMLKIMKQDTIPQDYLKVQEKYTSCGFRVLAMASKEIAINQIGSIRREEAESNLNFDGFEIFENKLKPETVGAIRELRRAAITVVIITGDNALTGANIGFKSGVIDRNLNAMIIDHEPNGRYSVKNFQ